MAVIADSLLPGHPLSRLPPSSSSEQLVLLSHSQAMPFRAWSYTQPPFPSTLALVPVTTPTEISPSSLLIEVHAAALNLGELPHFKAFPD